MPTDIHQPAGSEAPPPRVDATRARQGRWGRHVFWVLVVSTVLAALALFGAWTYRAKDLAAVEVNNGATTPAEAQRYDTPPQPARQRP
ncbi:hypothetical protein [uncultured Caulobacter sp.]|uniref:hypothetical protein n=1 Tax=uncultured Caulobacter sp. TaxID=158749 RepID=UPI002620CA8D|nr:hypothetical protein [uncultured Caulobacter sp.]